MELNFSGWQKKVLNEIWSRRFGNGTLRSGVLRHHPRLLSGLPFAGSRSMVQPTAGSYSADHLIFGMGYAVLQQVNRDTQRFGIKCSNLTKQPFLDSRRAITTASKKLARPI